MHKIMISLDQTGAVEAQKKLSKTKVAIAALGTILAGGTAIPNNAKNDISELIVQCDFNNNGKIDKVFKEKICVKKFNIAKKEKNIAKTKKDIEKLKIIKHLLTQ